MTLPCLQVQLTMCYQLPVPLCLACPEHAQVKTTRVNILELLLG